MNNDLIRREDAIRAGREIPDLIFDHYFGEGDVEALMNAIPAVDAEPVRHGRWIDNGDYVTTAYGSLDVNVCSNCNAEVTIDHYDSYCPNCGAKMDGDVIG